MKKALSSTIVALGLVIAVGEVARAGGGADEEDRLIRQGIALRKAGDDLAAWEVFKRAYDRSHSPRTAAQLGTAEQALGRWEDADVHVTEALRSTGDAWIEKNRPALEKSNSLIKMHLARIDLVGEPAGAEVLFNGRSVGNLPLPRPVGVSAGDVDVEVRAPGYAPARRQVTLVAGQYQRMVLRLEKEGEGDSKAKSEAKPAAVSTAAASSPGDDVHPRLAATPPPADQLRASPAPRPGPSARTIIKWSAFGLAAAALVTGIAATVIHEGKASDFMKAENEGCSDRDGQAVDMLGNPVAACQPILDAYYSARTWQIIGFASAGAFALAGAILLVTEPANHPAAVQASWRCGPALAGVGGSCALRF